MAGTIGVAPGDENGAGEGFIMTTLDERTGPETGAGNGRAAARHAQGHSFAAREVPA